MAEGWRFLHRHSEHGYTDRLDKAMHNEPEAVSREAQAALTAERLQQARDRFDLERGLILAAVDRIMAQPGSHRIRAQMHAIRHDLDSARSRLA